MLVANLHRNSHRLAYVFGRNQVHPAGVKSARVKLLVVAHYHLPGVVLDLNDIQRRTSGYAQSFALAHGEIMNSGMFADSLTVGGPHFARQHLAGNHVSGSAGRRASLLGKIAFEKTLVIASGDETDFLRVGLLGDKKAVLARQFADFGLSHAS